MMRTIYLKTTEACQLNCSHCFTGGSRPPRTFWDVAKVKDWITRFHEHIPESDEVHYELHGGEPMLAPLEQIREVVQHIRSVAPKHTSIGMTTNLVYKLKDEHLAFFHELDGFGTSWDPDIRFDNPKQETLWRENLQKVIESNRSVVLNVSVSKVVTQMDQEQLLRFFKSLGVYKVLFDRITPNGNANNHTSLFPSNQQINDWYLHMHDASERLNARSWFQNSALEDVYTKFENAMSSCGTFCRDCEERNITLNADGTVGGCPNSAPEEFFGHIDMTMPELMVSAKRLDVMAKERSRNEHCFTCPVFSYCGSDCHRLAWEGDICASPRQLMKKLAGLDYTDHSAKPAPKIIPIYAR